ncbi:uncharacterized protein LKV04_014845 isoform 2-T2 [Tautogolabrus adspersus]
MQINGVDLQGLTPEELAQMLAEGNPMLTIHKPGTMKEHTPQSFPAEDTLRPISKENTVLSFRMEMKREEDLEKNKAGHEEEDKGDGSEEEDCHAENGQNGKGGDLLVISMVKTTISVVRGRGCDMSSPCGGCQGTGCTYNDVVVVSETREVVLVPRGGGFKQLKQANYTIRHAASQQYLRGLCMQNTVFASPNPEKITIYTYKTTYISWFSKGKPVVLNFTGSNCFLRCCKEGDQVLLRAETCEKQRLKQISRSDESALSFVFFMKSDSSLLKFESALHSGWFIQIVNSQSVKMATLDGGSEDHSFFFIIQK